MPEEIQPAVPGTATVGGHPIHPMLVPLPIGLWLAALFSDIAYAATGEVFWASASLWLIGVGLVGALLAAVAGLADFLGSRIVRSLRPAWYHLVLNLLAVGVSVASLLLRLSAGVREAVVPWGLGASIVVAVLLVLSGWYGGELVYRHGVGQMSRRRS